MATFNETDSYQLCQDLKELASAWQAGDLTLVASLKAGFQNLVDSAQFRTWPKKLTQPWRKLAGTVANLLSELTAKAWLRALKAARIPTATEDFPAAPAAKPAPTLTPVAEPVATAAEAPQVAAERYPADYFDHIIEDPKMLGQLCEEVKEHIDITQYTLIDLEHDSTNPENINKIFRAFHTIKSSAAFLGLKNLEESAHAMEDVLVLVRDGKIPITKELIDLIFYGIGLLKDLVGIIETANFQIPVMVEAFRQIDIYESIRLFRRIQAEHAQKKIGEILRDAGKLDQVAVDHILERQRETQQKFGEIAVERQYVTDEDLKLAIHKQLDTRKSSYVKVSNERLNALIDIVGELVVNQSMLRQFLENADRSRDSGDRTFSQLESITTNIKNLVLSMGMVPIAEIFNKLRVIVRNTAAETGKLVTVDFKGAETELDRNVIETIYDPLVHIVRNAVDHGLETTADRVAAGKPELGRIAICAEHRGNSIEIEVADDGGGILPDRVIAKAVHQGLITEAQAAGLSEKEVYSLLFLPGFSTKEVVTEVSGRGVGLDVVKQNIDQIHGKVEIVSQPNKGSRFIIRIPLTLAIIDGFVMMVDRTKYVFPFNIIEEIVVPEPGAVSQLENGQDVLLNRSVYTPLIDAARIFGHPVRAAELDADLGETANRLVIVINYEQKRYGVAVDRVIGKQEIVIKSLNEALSGLRVFSGGTIFGDGSIGFVVDIDHFIEKARQE